MAFLESLDPMRKTRRGSFILLSANSQGNIGESEDGDLQQKGSFRSLFEVTHECSGRKIRTSHKEAMVKNVSAMYGKILVVCGMAFPIAEALAKDLPLIYYNSFYLYLYLGSIFFILFAYFNLLSDIPIPFASLLTHSKYLQVNLRTFTASAKRKFEKWFQKAFSKDSNNVEHLAVEDPPEISYQTDTESSSTSTDLMSPIPGGEDVNRKFVFTENAGHGSMYLKMGTIIFGIGSMIYSGLEFGQYFELKDECADILMAITPSTRMAFTFLQMYFIFLNSRVSIGRHTIIARFGIMHMVATNLCIWLNVLVEETKHTIHLIKYQKYQAENYDYATDDEDLEDEHSQYRFGLQNDSHSPRSKGIVLTPSLLEDLFDPAVSHNLVRRAASQPPSCRTINLMGDMVNSSAPLLYPCTIEYSLLCASVLYVMWKNIQANEQATKTKSEQMQLSNFIARKVRHLYSVDCGRASRGLFMGIFILVLTLISLIVFYVLSSDEEFTETAFLTANISEIIIYSIGIVTTVIGMKQMSELGFKEHEEAELDIVLLVIAQCGVYMFTLFTLIGGYFSTEPDSWLLQTNAAITLIQATLQTLYILDGSRRCCKTNEQLERKSGREMVTFLLVLNLAMWLLSTFQTSRATLHMAQKEFYGIWAWTIISHVSMPLGIFYRFHVTVCLGEMWKRAYKLTTE